MWDPKLFCVDYQSDGAVVITCGDEGMATDLVFASGATCGDKLLHTQREIAKYIVNAVRVYATIKTGPECPLCGAPYPVLHCENCGHNWEED